jgi:hypothetical protein
MIILSPGFIESIDESSSLSEEDLINPDDERFTTSDLKTNATTKGYNQKQWAEENGWSTNEGLVLGKAEKKQFVSANAEAKGELGNKEMINAFSGFNKMSGTMSIDKGTSYGSDEYYRRQHGHYEVFENYVITPTGIIRSRSRSDQSFGAYPRQIMEKPQSYANIQLIQNAGMDGKMNWNTFLSNFGLIPKYTRFFLQRTSYSSSEKMQIVEGFGDYRLYFFGKKPIVQQYDGMLINTLNQDWASDFEYVYENYLRGTQSVKLRAKLYLTFDHVVVSGYAFTAQFGKDATDNNMVPFSFQMIVTDRTPINLDPTSNVVTRNQLRGKLPSEARRMSDRAKEAKKKTPSSVSKFMAEFMSKGIMAKVA